MFDFCTAARKGMTMHFRYFYWVRPILEGTKMANLGPKPYKPQKMAAMNLPQGNPLRNKGFFTAGLAEIQYLRGRVNQS